MRIKSLTVLLGAGLLVLALADAAPVAAQLSCTVTYDCAGNSGCTSVMGGNVTQRNLSYASQSACDSAAASAQHGLPTIRCSCGGGGSTTTTSNITSIVSTMTPQQQMGTAVGAVGTLMILQGLSELMNGKPAPPPDPAVAQRALAAQQLNNSGIYLYKQKNYSGAINEFQQALALAPNDAVIRQNLASAQQGLKDHAVAAQNSSELSQFLGGSPTSANFPPQSFMAGANTSALNLVDLDSNVVDLRGATSTSPALLRSQLDAIFAPTAAVPVPPDQETAQEIDKQIDELYNKAELENQQAKEFEKQYNEQEFQQEVQQINKAQSEYQQFEKQYNEQEFQYEVQQINNAQSEYQQQLQQTQKNQQKVQDELKNVQPANSGSQPHN